MTLSATCPESSVAPCVAFSFVRAAETTSGRSKCSHSRRRSAWRRALKYCASALRNKATRSQVRMCALKSAPKSPPRSIQAQRMHSNAVEERSKLQLLIDLVRNHRRAIVHPACPLSCRTCSASWARGMRSSSSPRSKWHTCAAASSSCASVFTVLDKIIQ